MAGLLDLGVMIAGGLMSTIGAAKQAKVNARLANQEYLGQWQQIGIQDEQLLDEAKAVELQARQAVEARFGQAQDVKDKNVAWMSASGTSFNASQAIAARETDKNARKDAATLQYNSALQRNRISQQIRVNRMSLDTALSRAAATISQGTANTVGTAQRAGIDLLGSLVKDAGSLGTGGSPGSPGMTKG